MLTAFERLLFLILALFAVGATYSGFRDVYLVIDKGEGKLHFDGIFRRAWKALRVYVTQETTLKTRRVTSLLHWGVVIGFTYYFLINGVDTILGFSSRFEEWLTGLDGFGATVFNLYRLVGDVLSVVVLVGVVYFILRRTVLVNRKDLTYHDNILLHPKVAKGAQFDDSMVVAFFILLHVGARFLGESVAVAQQGADIYMPFATAISPLWSASGGSTLEVLRHVMWWVALGGILIFTPYFPYTKHFHLMMAPLNFLTRPKRTSLGELEALDMENEEIEQFGAANLFHLSKTQIFDAFACIQCNRCQDVCPAYVTGKELSPAALEVNKRYFIKDNLSGLANGTESFNLVGNVISESAVWACTSCAACIDVCPVGNEPMHDILDIRRNQVLMESEFPSQLQNAFNGMERNGNPWQDGRSRIGWIEGLEFDVPTIEENPDFDILYWTGCAVSYDPRAQETARALVKVMHKAGVNFAILGDSETCTGDVARRAGNEYLYFELASANVETLNEVKPPRIVATCPHCLHNIGKEYHQFGGEYEVIHHTELIDELISEGKIPPTANPASWSNVTFHDPCYLGRHNGVIDEPRNVLNSIGAPVIEMPRNKNNSFCCGAGGAQFWKEEEHGEKAVNLARYEEAMATGADTLAVGCPFCMQMFNTAKSEKADGPEVRDIVEMLAERL
ncbi:MAG: (Fe-S)-binding protein [Anaerolineae bacterium]|nr:(Fe-S)-binding protein [Anaerolineae bacterium]